MDIIMYILYCKEKYVIIYIYIQILFSSREKIGMKKTTSFYSLSISLYQQWRR